jgi:hypothetical protein
MIFFLIFRVFAFDFYMDHSIYLGINLFINFDTYKISE